MLSNWFKTAHLVEKWKLYTALSASKGLYFPILSSATHINQKLPCVIHITSKQLILYLYKMTNGTRWSQKSLCPLTCHDSMMLLCWQEWSSPNSCSLLHLEISSFTSSTAVATYQSEMVSSIEKSYSCLRWRNKPEKANLPAFCWWEEDNNRGQYWLMFCSLLFPSHQKIINLQIHERIKLNKVCM